uniref:Uncharacterized protein n=1 Tax=Trichuris muris TaxID=70415 RepID=A0A5S6R164_TRIMR
MSSAADATGHGVVPVKVHTKPAAEWQLAKFSTFQSGSQVEAVERRPAATVTTALKESIRRTVETSRRFHETASSLLGTIKQVSMMRTLISLESNIRSDLYLDVAIDESQVDELEVENLIDIDRQIGFACRFFGVSVGPPTEKLVSAVSLRNRIDAQIEFLLDCLRKVDPTWADKMNDCAKDIHLSKVIETLLMDVGHAHRGAVDSKASLQASRQKFFSIADTIEKTILWIYQTDQTASKRRQQETERRKNKQSLSHTELKELHTQLAWLYQVAIELARERRRFIEMCNLHLDIAKEVRLQRYDPENVVIRLNRRPPSTGMLVDHATALFSTFWDELMERVTQMRIVADEVKRLAENWKRDKQLCATMIAECDDLSKTTHPRKVAIEKLKQLLESDRDGSKELIDCFEAVIVPLQRTTAHLQEQGAQRERARAEAMKKGAAAALDPVLDDPILTEIQKKEEHLQDVLLRRYEVRVSRAEALERLQHSLCHKEKEMEQLIRNCDNLIGELTEIKEETETVEQENRVLKGNGGKRHNEDKKLDAIPEDTNEELTMLQEEEQLKAEIMQKKRRIDHLIIERSNTKLKIQCLERQKAIIDAASEEKLKTIREFERHIADSKRAVDDRRRYKVTDPLPQTHGKQKIEELQANKKRTAEMLNTLLTELEICLKKHAEISTANLQRMDAHRTWCYKNAAKEMEVDWNKLQLRKLECEKGVRSKCHLLRANDEEGTLTPIRNVGQSPIILYHELTSPERANLLKEKTSGGQDGYEAMYSPTIRPPPQQEHKSLLPNEMQTPKASFSQSTGAYQDEGFLYTIEETKEVQKRSYTAYHPAGRLKWKTTIGPTGQPQLVSLPTPITEKKKQESTKTGQDPNLKTEQPPGGVKDGQQPTILSGVAQSDITTTISVGMERLSPKGDGAKGVDMLPDRQGKQEPANPPFQQGEAVVSPEGAKVERIGKEDDKKTGNDQPGKFPGESGTQPKQ